MPWPARPARGARALAAARDGRDLRDDGTTHCEYRRRALASRRVALRDRRPDAPPLSPTPRQTNIRAARKAIPTRGVWRLLRGLGRDLVALLALRPRLVRADGPLVLLLIVAFCDALQARHDLAPGCTACRPCLCVMNSALAFMNLLFFIASCILLAHPWAFFSCSSSSATHHPRDDGHRGRDAQAEADVVGPQERRAAVDDRAPVALRRHRTAGDGPARAHGADDRVDASSWRGTPRGHREHGGAHQGRDVLIGDSRRAPKRADLPSFLP